MLHCSIFNVRFLPAFRSKQKLLYYTGIRLSTKTYRFFKFFSDPNLPARRLVQTLFFRVGDDYIIKKKNPCQPLNKRFSRIFSIYLSAVIRCYDGLFPVRIFVRFKGKKRKIGGSGSCFLTIFSDVENVIIRQFQNAAGHPSDGITEADQQRRVGNIMCHHEQIDLTDHDKG